MLKRGHGFTLIEVLVTLVILAFGLLGLAGLIMKGHRASFEAYQRHQATALASDLAERMKANQSEVTANTPVAAAYVAGAPVDSPLGDPDDPAKYNAIQGTGAPNCSAAGVTCTRAQMVAYDLGRWEGALLGVNEQVAGASRGGMINARGCVEGPLAAPSPPSTYRISVAWQGDAPTVAPTSSACGQGLYAPDTTRRVVSIDVTIRLP